MRPLSQLSETKPNLTELLQAAPESQKWPPEAALQRPRHHLQLQLPAELRSGAGAAARAPGARVCARPKACGAPSALPAQHGAHAAMALGQGCCCARAASCQLRNLCALRASTSGGSAAARRLCRRNTSSVSSTYETCIM